MAVHDRGARLCGIVTFTVAGHDTGTVLRALADHSINVSESVLQHALWDFEARGLSSAVRASVHYYNTEEEIDRLCSVVASL